MRFIFQILDVFSCDECCDNSLKVKDFKDDCTEIQFYQLKRVD